MTVLCFGLLTMVATRGQKSEYVTVQRVLKLMGSRFEITVVSPSEEIGFINIEEAAAEISRIEKIISSWDSDSETTRINKNAGIRPVKVSYELFKLIERSIQISELTSGAFDISYAPMDNLWKFDGSMKYIPTASEIESSVSKVGYDKIVLNSSDQTVFLKQKGMKIAFGAIGKGYAVDRVKELLVSKQVPAGMINASGDITTWGTKATGEKWLIGIANPSGNGKIVSWLPILESSVGIAGTTDKYVTIKGEKYSHIIDPRSGYPTSGIDKVTVLAKSAELCDALATAIYVLGKDKGLALINQLGGTEVLIVDNNNRLFKSNGVILDLRPK